MCLFVVYDHPSLAFSGLLHSLTVQKRALSFWAVQCLPHWARTHETLSSSYYIGLALFLAFHWMPDFVIDASSMTPRSICFLFWCYHYHGTPASCLLHHKSAHTVSCFCFSPDPQKLCFLGGPCLFFFSYTHAYASVQSHVSPRRLEEDAGYPVQFLPYSLETVSLSLNLSWAGHQGCPETLLLLHPERTRVMGEQPGLTLFTWRPGYFNPGVQACATVSTLTY